MFVSHEKSLKWDMEQVFLDRKKKMDARVMGTKLHGQVGYNFLIGRIPSIPSRCLSYAAISAKTAVAQSPREVPEDRKLATQNSFRKSPPNRPHSLVPLPKLNSKDYKGHSQAGRPLRRSRGQQSCLQEV